MPTAQPKRYYSVKEASNLLGVSTNTIYSYLDTGKLKGRRIGRGRFKIPYKELSPFIDFSDSTVVAENRLETNETSKLENTKTHVRVEENVPIVETVENPESHVDLVAIKHPDLTGKSRITETNILLPQPDPTNSDISPMKNDKIFWRLFKALVFVGLGLIYIGLGKLNLDLGGGYLNETSQILEFLLPIGLLASGILVLLDVFFEKKIEYFDTLIHVFSVLVVGYFSFISIASGQYGVFVFASSFTILLASHLVTGVKHRGTFFETLVKFSVLAATINGVLFILFPSYFPFPLASSLISDHKGLFGFLWFSLTTLPFLFLLSPYGKNSKLFTPLYLLFVSVLRLLLATQLTVFGMWDTAYISYLLGIFGLFLAWWKGSNISISSNRFVSLAGSFVWVAIAILIGLTVVVKSTTDLNTRSQEIVLSSVESAIAKIQNKIDNARAVLTSSAGNTDNLSIVKEGDAEKNIALAKTIYNQNDLAERVLVMNKEGIAYGVYPREALAQGTNFSTREYFMMSKESNKGFASDVFINILGHPVIVITEPIFEGNEFSGLIVLALDLQKLSLLIFEEAGKDTEIHVLYSHGIYAFGSNTSDIGKEKGSLEYLKFPDTNENDLSDRKMYKIESQNPKWEYLVVVNEKDLLSDSSYINLILSIFVVVNSAFSVFAGVAISNRKNDNKPSNSVNLANDNLSLGSI